MIKILQLIKIFFTAIYSITLGRLSKPQKEALKEVARWIVLFAGSWIITQIINQIVLIPEFWNIKIWEFVFPIPLQSTILGFLTMLGRFLDKLKFEMTKELSKVVGSSEVVKGILPF